jgi:hypothetical protein
MISPPPEQVGRRRRLRNDKVVRWSFSASDPKGERMGRQAGPTFPVIGVER